MTPPLPHGLVLWSACTLLVAVGLFDILWRRIPNALVALLALGGLLHDAMLGGTWRTLEASVVGAGIGLGLLAWPFARGMLGGGDVKLMGALGVWVGPIGVLRVLCWGAIGGGLLALAQLLLLPRSARQGVRKNLRALSSGSLARGESIRSLHVEHLTPARGIPYGVALAAAGAWLLCGH